MRLARVVLTKLNMCEEFIKYVSDISISYTEFGVNSIFVD